MHTNINPIFNMKDRFLLDAPLSFLFCQIVSPGSARTAKIPKFSPFFSSHIGTYEGCARWWSYSIFHGGYNDLVLIFLSNTLSTTRLSLSPFPSKRIDEDEDHSFQVHSRCRCRGWEGFLFVLRLGFPICPKIRISILLKLAFKFS